MTTARKSNRLIHSTSPYLLQHAYNPVDWFEWGSEALEKAVREDKPMLVSIGYSSCHWCHVMERESFENEDIAAIMNEFFVCIKVDREERPDIDQVYMDAVQALGVNGGWPLNVFLTPEQKPFFGGTYFQPATWAQILTNINKAFGVNRKAIEQTAEDLRVHLLRSDVERFKQTSHDASLQDYLKSIYNNLSTRFDRVWGGMDKAPKFVMPSVWLWLMRYHHLTKHEEALQQVLLTLKRVAMGGIYDQVGGGFSRYSVDEHWFVPHFEKMLYDNAQLLSVYAEAYAITNDNEFKTIIYETYRWLTREMTNAQGGFYSALDADSEGVEGKYYCWTKAEIEKILGKDADHINTYFSVNEKGNWEHGVNILIRNASHEEFINTHNLTSTIWESSLLQAKMKLLEVREKRIKPGLDDKVILSWNAMMVCGLVDAYKAIGDEIFLQAALTNLNFLTATLAEGTTVYRSYKGKRSATPGFLDDYAFLIQAFLRLYSVTFDESLIRQAETLTHHVLDKFFDTQDGYFHYTSRNSEQLIASKKEIFDNVIPSSNAIMALNLFHLGTLLDKKEWKDYATQMAEPLSNLIQSEPYYMSQWAIVLTLLKKEYAEVSFIGSDVQKLAEQFQRHYQPFTLTLATAAASTLPLLAGKKALNNKTTVYVCYHNTCKKPVHTIGEALQQIT
ncbi:MAG: thioredoxin domain-containing protein [Cyclobacteriaceae bacterium]|nr:thioredoxin domain-containing protein [Cyclobacteriaceae bacterium]